MNLNRNSIVEVLNDMYRNDVVDSDGGDYCYQLVEDNEANRNKLRDVGVTDQQISNVTEDGYFCLLQLAFNERLADDFAQEFTIWEPLVDDELRYRVLNGDAIPSDAERLLQELEKNEQRIKSFTEALQEGPSIGMKSAEEFIDYLYSVLPFIHENYAEGENENAKFTN